MSNSKSNQGHYVLVDYKVWLVCGTSTGCFDLAGVKSNEKLLLTSPKRTSQMQITDMMAPHSLAPLLVIKYSCQMKIIW
jgi:hypothetical protein